MSTDYHSMMLRNAEELRQLYSQIKSTYKIRDESAGKFENWKNACRVFHEAYAKLAFPGGSAAINGITTGDQDAMESAICFLECRPYFHRSGYLFDKLLRRLKKAPLSEEQKQRLQIVIEKKAAWRKIYPDNLRARAEKGDAKAQLHLAELYAFSRRVKHDSAEAEKWFRKAAQQGISQAQSWLASDGLWKKNFEDAYFWYGVMLLEPRSEYGRKYITDKRDNVAKNLTSAQIEVLDKRVAEWKPTPEKSSV